MLVGERIEGAESFGVATDKVEGVKSAPGRASTRMEPWPWASLSFCDTSGAIGDDTV